MKTIHVILEIGKKKTFASALDWPGWSRAGRDEESALGALLEYGKRYGAVLRLEELAFQPPSVRSAFSVIERLEGGAGTDFGAPEAPAEAEVEPPDLDELNRLQSLLRVYWKAFDNAVQQAEGRELRKGPRGGGRELEHIVRHVIEADKAYLRRLAWKPEKTGEMRLEEDLKYTRAEILATLERAVKEGLPAQGPRGGKIWPARYFVRRSGWHVLDHAWEIEDRIVSE
jgi:hypothetical protein